MAEIEIERRPPRRTGLWVGLLVLVLLLAAGWYFLMGPGLSPMPGEGDRADGASDTLDVAAPLPPPPVPAAVDTGGAFDTVPGSVPDTGGA